MFEPSPEEELLSGLRDNSLSVFDTVNTNVGSWFDFADLGPYHQNHKEFILQELRQRIIDWSHVRKEPNETLEFIESFSEMEDTEIKRRGILFAHANSFEKIADQLSNHEGLSDALIAAKNVDCYETFVLKRYCIQIVEETGSITIFVLDFNKYVNRQVNEYLMGFTAEYQLQLTAYEYFYKL